MRKLYAITLFLCLCMISVSYSENNTAYPTEHLQNTNTDAEAEFVERVSEVEDNNDRLIFTNEFVSISLLDWVVDGDQIHTSFSVTSIGDQICLIMPNLTQTMYEEDVGISALLKIREMGGGTLIYYCSPGDTLEFVYTWDLGNVYDNSFFGSLYPNSPSVSDICPIHDFPKDNHLGISCMITTSEYNPVDYISGSLPTDTVKIINLQIIPE